MTNPINRWLLAGAILSAIASLLHLACIVGGAPWYRFFGAGERMTKLAEAGHWYPAVTTVVIATVLAIWSAYALSGAGVVGRLPLLKAALCIITAIFLLRGVAFLPLMSRFPENSMAFWYWSSAICFAIGLVHLLGLRQAWSRLSS